MYDLRGVGQISNMQFHAEQRMLNYWGRIRSAKDGKFNKTIYQVTLKMHSRGLCEFPWIAKLKQLLNDCHLYQCWLRQSVPNNFKANIKTLTTNLYENKWKESIFNSKKCYNYRMFKKELELERYLLLLPTPLRINLARFRLVNHKLPVEQGRYENLARHERKCSMCSVI